MSANSTDQPILPDHGPSWMIYLKRFRIPGALGAALIFNLLTGGTLMGLLGGVSKRELADKVALAVTKALANQSGEIGKKVDTALTDMDAKIEEFRSIEVSLVMENGGEPRSLDRSEVYYLGWATFRVIGCDRPVPSTIVCRVKGKSLAEEPSGFRIEESTVSQTVGGPALANAESVIFNDEKSVIASNKIYGFEANAEFSLNLAFRKYPQGEPAPARLRIRFLAEGKPRTLDVPIPTTS